ncbi:MAG TPA: hypothetical protein VII38_16510 [Polyangia bacterium]|jgi:hypothetical protein
MLRRTGGLCGTALLIALTSVGCHRHEAEKSAPPKVVQPPAPPPLEPLGTLDPFGRLSPDGARALSRSWKALHAKKWDDAARELTTVIASAPDYLNARWELVRALALAGNFAALPAAYEPLLARDFIGYAGKLDRGRDFAPLRASPTWAQLTALEARYRAAFPQGLDGGFFLVARTRPATEPSFASGVTDAPLQLAQEIFHYDPASRRFRRLTDTGGRAFALLPLGHTLSYLVASKLHREGGTDSFVDPQVGTLDLTTLERVGPMVMKGRYDQVVLGQNQAGAPLYSFLAGPNDATYTFDSAHTALAKLEGDAVIPHGGETRAWPGQVAHLEDAQVAGVHITDGAQQFTIDGVATPVIAARPIAQSSLEWSPHRARLTYAGKLDACKLAPDGAPPAKNELYVFDVAKKTAQRISSALSSFETLWLDDDHLVYEGGVGKDGRIHVYDFAAHADQSLPTRHGAGLYGVPTLACERAEGGVDEDLGQPADDEAD